MRSGAMATSVTGYSWYALCFVNKNNISLADQLPYLFCFWYIQ
jgi:hypothetical protein